MVKKNDWVQFDGKTKKCFGVHTNGNILLKINNTLVQVHPERITKHN